MACWPTLRSEQKIPCTHCSNLTHRLHPILENPLCRSCQSTRQDLYQYVCATTARKDYCLTEADLAKLKVPSGSEPISSGRGTDAAISAVVG